MVALRRIGHHFSRINPGLVIVTEPRSGFSAFQVTDATFLAMPDCSTEQEPLAPIVQLPKPPFLQLPP
jgi:hypothetical protein